MHYLVWLGSKDKIYHHVKYSIKVIITVELGYSDTKGLHRRKCQKRCVITELFVTMDT